jgi:hypothetical protein
LILVICFFIVIAHSFIAIIIVGREIERYGIIWSYETCTKQYRKSSIERDFFAIEKLKVCRAITKWDEKLKTPNIAIGKLTFDSSSFECTNVIFADCCINIYIIYIVYDTECVNKKNIWQV